MSKDRKAVPEATKRTLRLEAGFRCSVPRCDVQWPTLHFHHIDEDPSNNSVGNLLVICPTHHQQATSGHISRMDCEVLKRALTAFAAVPQPPESGRRNLLYSFAAELAVNERVLEDPRFRSADPAVVYPRLMRNVSDRALSAGEFVCDADKTLFWLLWEWVTKVQSFNARIDLLEQRMVLVSQTKEDARDWHRGFTNRFLPDTQELFSRVKSHLRQEYGSEIFVRDQSPA